MQAIPTLLTTSKEEFETQILLFQTYFSRIQIDVADGQLVSNTTTSIEDIKTLIASGTIALSKELVLDFHLMVADFHGALSHIASLKEFGVNINCVLVNASLKPQIKELENTYGFSIGLDIFPQTEVKELAQQYDLNEVPAVQVMTVNPGFQGSPFLPGMLKKIIELRKYGYEKEILIDGGVNENTLPTILQQTELPDVLCIGSYLTKAGDELTKRVENLRKL
ncbi:hypothetical protein KC726_02660 [Candidatus Woesebacteria bacterium]|nr:hypothetical protein [Candidatus Woesebacteria bacterium]